MEHRIELIDLVLKEHEFAKLANSNLSPDP
jgi:hypothetical protein